MFRSKNENTKEYIKTNQRLKKYFMINNKIYIIRRSLLI